VAAATLTTDVALSQFESTRLPALNMANKNHPMSAATASIGRVTNGKGRGSSRAVADSVTTHTAQRLAARAINPFSI
jgi:hypothetical protein